MSADIARDAFAGDPPDARAHLLIAAISGQVNSMTHSMPWPNWAPTCE
jgi:hypothetical protein